MRNKSEDIYLKNYNIQERKTMKKIFFFVGKMDYSFFLNEIQYLKKKYETVEIIAYAGNRNVYDKISQEYSFNYNIIKNISLFSFFSPFFFKWFFKYETLNEIKENFSLSKTGLKKILYILLYGNFCVSIQKQIRQLLKQETEEILLYSYWLTRGAYSFCYLKNEMKNTKIRVISRAHGYDLYENRNSLNYLPFRRYIDNHIDRIYFISEHGKNYFQNRYKFGNMHKYSISRLGIENTFNLRKKIIPKNCICIASCSSIIEIKRLDILIDILSRLKIDFYWIHLGEGNLSQKIKKQAEKVLNHRNYKFYGNVKNSEILNIYLENDVDYFINTSDSEGIPVSIMEAISFGIPCIGRNVGGMREIVNIQTGLLLDEIDYEKIEKFLEIRLNNVKAYENISRTAIEFWRKNYNAKNNYNVFLEKVEEN